MVRMVASASDCGGSTQELSPECTPASSMCSMMPAISTSSPSRQRVHVHFGGVFEEPVDQYRALLREGDGFAHVLAHHLLVVGDHHGAPAQHVAGAHQHGVADASRHRAGLLDAGGGAVGGAGNSQIVEQLAEQLAVFGQIDIGRVGADDGHAQRA